MMIFLDSRRLPSLRQGPTPGRPNFADCLSYALAENRGVPLLFNGNDFTQPDVAIAI